MRLIRFLILLLLLPVKAVLGLDGPAEADRAAEKMTGENVPAAATLSFVEPPAGQERYRLVDRDAAAGDQAAIEVRGDAGKTLTSIVELDNPPVESHEYVVRGRVKYENVEGAAYLEMWNEFGIRGAYFSRTLAEVGPFRSISGSSDWRDIELPFRAAPGMKPSRIAINVLMPGTGTIFLSPLTIQSVDDPAEARRAARAQQRQKSPATSTLQFIPPEAGQERYRLVKRDGSATDQAAVEIRGDAGKTLTSIIVLDNPPVESHQYVVRGRVKYEQVEGTASLEMWNDFGSRGGYFTRTIADVGPLRSISGSSDWRDIELPFRAEPGMKPARITINVVMPGKGTILLSPLTLQTVKGSAAAWWSEPQSGLVGGVGGTVLAILVGTIGLLVSLRRARGLVVSLIVTGVACGIGLFVAGVIALCLQQPFFVVYPLLLLGGVTALVLGINAPNILRRYREDEFRKMAALDATAFGPTPATSCRG